MLVLEELELQQARHEKLGVVRDVDILREGVEDDLMPIFPKDDSVHVGDVNVLHISLYFVLANQLPGLLGEV